MTAKRKPYTKRERAKLTQDGFGYRSTNEWGSGDLPSPWAQGDVVYVPEGAKALERMRGRLMKSSPTGRADLAPGHYVVSYAPSIDEGNVWFVRVATFDPDGYYIGSDRLHTSGPGGSNIDLETDWMAGVELVETADPEGLALRQKMLGDGWTYTPPKTCPTCGQRTGRGFEVASVAETPTA